MPVPAKGWHVPVLAMQNTKGYLLRFGYTSVRKFLVAGYWWLTLYMPHLKGFWISYSVTLTSPLALCTKSPTYRRHFYFVT